MTPSRPFRLPRLPRLPRLGAAVAVTVFCAACTPGAGHGPSGVATSTRSSGPGSAGASSASPASPASPPGSLAAVTEAWRLPAPVSRPVVLPDGAGFVVLGGLATGDVSTGRVVQVDPATGTARLAGQLALAVHDSAGAYLDGKWFVFGGGSYSTVSVVQAWSGGPATEVGRLPEARSDLSAATVGGTTYVLGGFDGEALTPDVLATTDGVTWKTVAQLSVPVRYAAVAAADGALWVVGGVVSTSEGGTAETDAVQKVDLATGQTTVVAHLPAPMGHATAVALDGGVFVLGGRSGPVPQLTIWAVDPSTGSLRPAGSLPEALSDAGSVVVGGTAYLVGGEVTGPADPLDTVVALRPGA